MIAARPRATGLTTALWQQITPIMVPVHAVVPTQAVQPEHLGRIAGPSHSGDPYAHVVVENGRWLLEDGHHRWATAVQAGQEWFPARVYVACDL